MHRTTIPLPQPLMTMLHAAWETADTYPHRPKHAQLVTGTFSSAVVPTMAMQGVAAAEGTRKGCAPVLGH